MAAQHILKSPSREDVRMDALTSMLRNSVSPYLESVSYEALWTTIPNATLKTVSEQFHAHGDLPSAVFAALAHDDMFREALLAEIKTALCEIGGGFSVCFTRVFDYPDRLQAARYPVDFFYYRGDLGLTASRCVSVVGARECTPEGRTRAAKLAAGLSEAGFTIVSGLAKGIDTAAMQATIGRGGHTVGVIGTPINEAYPKENRDLQNEVAEHHLLISHVPFFRYKKQPFPTRKFYFLERNETMAALSEGTVIVEASETSGTHSQARECLRQQKKLFILNSCFENPRVKWPANYEKRGAIRVKSVEDVVDALGKDDGDNGAKLETG
jgi:DNA processing protein